MNKNIFTTIAVIAVFCVAAFALLRNPVEQDAMIPQPGAETTDSDPITSTTTTTTTTVVAPTAGTKKTVYKSGTYSAVGNYNSPGGPETIDVKLTLVNDVITDATVVANATLPASVNWQGAFISGYKQFVIGKNIDEVNLSKVSGSSLTPKGFNEALIEIKAEAKA